MTDESDTYELEGTLANARYWHRRAEKAEAALKNARDPRPRGGVEIPADKTDRRHRGHE